MRKSIIAGLVHSHVGGSFGSYARVYRDTPDGEHDNNNAFLGGDGAGWGHDTVIDGNNLLGIGDLADAENNPNGVVLDDDGEEEPDEEEEEAAPEKTKKKKEPEEEEEPDDEEEPEEEEPDEEEAEEEVPKGDLRTPFEKKADSCFKQLRLAEAQYRKAQAENEKPLDVTTINKPLVDERNALLRERSKLDPVANDEDADRIADIDIQLEDIRTRLTVSAQEATIKRNSLTENSTRDADKAVNDTLAAIAAAYPALDSAHNGANEKAIKFFNTMQKSYADEGKTVTDALEQAMKDTVDMFKLRSGKAKLSEKERKTRTQEEARNGVKKRLDAAKKQPVRGSRRSSKPETSLAALVGKDFGDKEVQKQLNAQLGIRFDA